MARESGFLTTGSVSVPGTKMSTFRGGGKKNDEAFHIIELFQISLLYIQLAELEEKEK